MRGPTVIADAYSVMYRIGPQHASVPNAAAAAALRMLSRVQTTERTIISLSTHHNLHSLCEELTYCLRPFVETAVRADAQVPIMTDDVGGGRGFTL